MDNMSHNNKHSNSNSNALIPKPKSNDTRIGDYLLGKTIGQGAFAKVKIATHIHTQEKVAIKVLDKAIIADNEKDIHRIQKEINILKQLRHKNIIQLYEIMETTNNLYLVMDYCEGKELFEYIIKHNKLNEKKACRFFQQIINGVEYLHMQNITHRDLKPENLLLDSNKNIIISDFGLSYAIPLSIATTPDGLLLQTPCGTPSYAPPEMLRGDKYLGSKSDIWSCGIILYTMLCGNLPCAESKEELIYQCFYNNTFDYPSHLSACVVDLIKRLLKFNPDERIGFDQIKRHPWFSLIKPQMKPGIIVHVHRIPIDEDILNKVELYGYNKADCKQSVLENKCNHLSAMYYLILKQFIREGKQSISDMNSEVYMNYIRSIGNWVLPEEYSKPEYKDYWISNRVDLRAKSQSQPKTLSENSSRQCDTIKSIVLNNDNDTSIKITESNTSINSHNHLPFNVSIMTNDINVNCTISNNKKQTTFTSSSKRKQGTKSFYPYFIPNQIQHLNSIEDYTFPIEDPITSIKTDHKEEDNSLMLSHNDTTTTHTDININAQSLLLNLKTKVAAFNKDMNTITSYINTNDNIIPLIAKKLIKTTIFKKFLISKAKPNHLPLYKDELEDKFYTLQKYKHLVETIKSTHRNVFPRKILDWNYYTFNAFLNDKEDLIFSDAYTKSNPNANFIQRLKLSKRNEQVSLRKSLLRMGRQHVYTRSADTPTFNRALLLLRDKDQLNHSICDSYSSSKHIHNKRLNRFLITSPTHCMPNDYIDNHKYGRSGSKSHRSIRDESRERSTIHLPTCTSNYSYSSMNNISEDEEWVKNRPNKNMKQKHKRIIIGEGIETSNIVNSQYDIRPRSKYEKKSKNNHNEAQRNSSYTYHNNNNNNKQLPRYIMSPAKSPMYNRSNLHSSPICNSNNKNLNRNIGSYTNLSAAKGGYKQTNFFHINHNDNWDSDSDSENKYYDAPVIDCRCVFQANRSTLLSLLKLYLKQQGFFCNHIGDYRLKCSKANFQFEFEVMKLKIKIKEDTSLMTYLCIKKNKGGNREYLKIMKALINALPI